MFNQIQKVKLGSMIDNFDDCIFLSEQTITKKEIQEKFSHSFDGDLFALPISLYDSFMKDYKGYLGAQDKKLSQLTLSDEDVGGIIFTKKLSQEFLVIDPLLDSIADDALVASRFISQWIEKNKVSGVYRIGDAHLFDNLNFFQNEISDDFKFYAWCKEGAFHPSFLWQQLFVIENAMPCDIFELDRYTIKHATEDFSKNIVSVMEKLLDFKEQYSSVMVASKMNASLSDIKTFFSSSFDIDVKNSVSADLKLMLVNEINDNDKLQQAAQQLGVKIMTENEFLNDIFSPLDNMNQKIIKQKMK